MVRQPQNLEEAKQIFREEKTKVTSSLAALAGSRWLMAILATLVIAFGSQALYAPGYLPTPGGFSIAALGLPPVDFGFVGEQATQAAEAAGRSDAANAFSERLAAEAADNPQFIPTLNYIGLGAAFVLLMINMTIMTKRRRVSRG
ncbi:MAG: hypothetical protein K2X34_10280 [Hyphomonadaceae bacterium]|nr:hypothetical protein [Hyphomonadaceae bacterium]